MGVNGLDMCRISFIINWYTVLCQLRKYYKIYIEPRYMQDLPYVLGSSLADLKKVRMIQNVTRKLMEVTKNIQINN